MAEAPRNLQLPSGYDEEFADEVEEDFLCLICHLPAEGDFVMPALRNISEGRPKCLNSIESWVLK